MEGKTVVLAGVLCVRKPAVQRKGGLATGDNELHSVGVLGAIDILQGSKF